VFATVAWIDDAFGMWMARASTLTARVAFAWTFDDVSAVTTFVVEVVEWAFVATAAVAVVFTMGDQWARFVVAIGGRHSDAFLAWSQMTRNGVARIGFASILIARALVAWTFFDDALLSGVARIRTAVGFFAVAVQTRTRAKVGAVVPFVVASVWWSWQCEFRAGWSSPTAIVAFFQGQEIVLIATAAGIIERDALTASDIVGPATNVIMASTVIDSLTAAMTIVFATTSVHQAQTRRSDDSEQNDEFHSRIQRRSDLIRVDDP
jgi:hypothetical protein